MNYAALFVGLALPIIGLTSACDSRATQDEVSGVESFCVESIDGPDGLELQVNVQVSACLSSGCNTLLETECTLTDVGGALQIEASAVIETKGNTCNADCGGVAATCTVPAVEGETYLLRGDDGDEVEIKARGETTCSVEPI